MSQPGPATHGYAPIQQPLLTRVPHHPTSNGTRCSINSPHEDPLQGEILVNWRTPRTELARVELARVELAQHARSEGETIQLEVVARWARAKLFQV